jgi:hypothetical protein
MERINDIRQLVLSDHNHDTAAHRDKIDMRNVELT